MSPKMVASTLRLAELPEPVRAWLLTERYDRCIEKHEGPWEWDWLVAPEPYDTHDPATGGRRKVQPEAAEFLAIEGRDVLLPEGRDHHPNFTCQWVVPSEDGRSLTLFLIDTTYEKGMGAGRIAFCERVPEGDWYLCRVWHEWYPT